MTVLGVPPETILLERDALHTDENVYYSLRLANEAGLKRLAVASNGFIASWMCGVMVQWGHACSGIALDLDALSAFLRPHDAALHALRAHRTKDWEPLVAREARIAKVNGHSRPPSFVLYPLYGWLGPTHRPMAPEHPPPLTWAARLDQLRTLP
jgi:hypothetical protein